VKTFEVSYQVYAEDESEAWESVDESLYQAFSEESTLSNTMNIKEIPSDES